MSDQVVQGYFWLPDSPEVRWPGALTISDEGDELSLMYAHGPNGIRDHALSDQSIPVLFGSLLSLGSVTIRGARPSGKTSRNMKVGSVGYWWFDLLIGAHVRGDTYNMLSLNLEWLSDWAPLQPLDLGNERELIIPLEEDPLVSARISDSKLSLVRSVGHSWSLLEITVNQTCSIRIEGSGFISDLISEWVTPIQDLMLVILGYRPGALGISVGFPMDEPQGPGWAEFRPRWPRLGVTNVRPPGPVGDPSYSKTILLPNDNLFDCGNLISEWFDTRKELGVPVAMLNAASRSGNTHAEHRYLTLFIALDALAKLSEEIDTKAMPPREFGERIASLEKVLDPNVIGEDVRSWALNILKGKNQKSQKRTIEDFLVQSMLLPSDSIQRIAAVLSNVRVDIAHNGVIKDITRDYVAHRVIWLTELMEWILRAELLVQLGAPRSNVVSRLEANSKFRRTRINVIESLSNGQ